MKMNAPVLRRIAGFITSANTFEISTSTLHQVKRIIADTIGTAYSGVRLPAFTIALKALENKLVNGGCEVWGTELRLNSQDATFLNALAISSTDYDEGHRKAVGHPASLTVPVAMALGEELRVDFNKVLRAVLVGYETGTRFSMARKPESVTTYSSGRWGALASSATAAVLLDLTVEQTMNALSLAAVLSPVMLGGSTDVSTGSMAKEGVAWAAQTGLRCALLAKNGFSGPYLFIDDLDDYDKSQLIERLGETWMTDTNYFKPFACCRWLHSAVEAGLALKRDYDFDCGDIEAIDISVFGRAIDLVENTFPENTVQAQFHLPYCVATALKHNNLLPAYFSGENLNDKELKRIISVTNLTRSVKYDKLFPGKLPSSVTIRLKNGAKLSLEVLSAPWDAGNHPTDEQLYEKFISQTGETGKTIWDKVLF